jgi:ATP-dependent DNA helicase RecG
MEIREVEISKEKAEDIKKIMESHFVDLKGAKITPAKLSRTISAFANTSGGEIYIGVDEIEAESVNTRMWDGFSDKESANPIFQVMQQLNPLENNYSAEFFIAQGCIGLLLHLTIFKTQEVVLATDGKAYVRRNAQNLPIRDGADLERLKFDKGVKSFENEFINMPIDDVANSSTMLGVVKNMIPTADPVVWLEKQRVIKDGRPTVAGVLLYADLPQAILPKRSAIKILRYRTEKSAERDFLVFDPLTVEGPIYNLIFDAVKRIQEVIEKIEKISSSGMERIKYPEEAVHEILTNAVLHRDYNIIADIQVRIFDNRVEIESPGRLPGHVTVENITKTQFARNPKIVRLINKFPNPPNKDVGEGLNTAIEAMGKLRLKPPIIQEGEGSVIVTLYHERLGSPEQIVLLYLEQNLEITNAIARKITGIKSENTMKNVFYRLRNAGELEQTPKVKGRKISWRRPC